MSFVAGSPEAGAPPLVEADGPRDHCGIWASWDPQNPDLTRDAFIGLKGVQHRGESGAGVAIICTTLPGIYDKRGDGLVTDVFGDDGRGMDDLPVGATAIIGHTRYATDTSLGEGLQPRIGQTLALAHNGQITNKEFLSAKYDVDDATTDTDVVARAIDKVAMRMNGDVERATLQVLPDLEGAFCLTILTQDKLIAVRDRHGVRPLQLGRTETGGYMVASEWMAIEYVEGATWEREIDPAEMVVIDKHGLRSGKWAEADPATCVFEYAYLSNKTNIINGIRVEDARHQFGQRLAPYIPQGLTAIVPVPNSGIHAAHGLSEATGIPYKPALTKKTGYGRSFIQSTEESRIYVAENKQHLDAAMIEGEDAGAVDDTIVRGHSSRANARKLYGGNAKSVHLIVAAPPYTNSCSLGVDTGRMDELLSVRMGGDIEKMRQELEVDSLTFLPRAEMREVLGNKVCDFCIGGSKPNIIKDDPELLARLAGELALAEPQPAKP